MTEKKCIAMKSFSDEHSYTLSAFDQYTTQWKHKQKKQRRKCWGGETW